MSFVGAGNCDFRISIFCYIFVICGKTPLERLRKIFKLTSLNVNKNAQQLYKLSGFKPAISLYYKYQNHKMNSRALRTPRLGQLKKKVLSRLSSVHSLPWVTKVVYCSMCTNLL